MEFDNPVRTGECGMCVYVWVVAVWGNGLEIGFFVQMAYPCICTLC